jgi:heme A synthase
MSEAVAEKGLVNRAGQAIVPASAQVVPHPRWLHRWAILTVCAAFPLLLLGAQVTTLGAGMVDQQSVREPWHVFTVSFSLENFAYLIEHSHRFFGWLVGACSIVLAAASWYCARHSLVRWLGLLALVAVSAQGVLGIIRVKYNPLAGTEFALIHGLFAQLAFAILVSTAVVTSPGWQRGARASSGLRGPALALTLVVYGQIAFGAIVRHLMSRTAQRLHVLIAFGVVACIFWVFLRVRERGDGDRGLVRFSWLLACLVTVQVVLGVEAWINRFGAGLPAEAVPLTWGRVVVRTAHYLVGALLFATSIGFALWTWRPAHSPVRSPSSPFAEAAV